MSRWYSTNQGYLPALRRAPCSRALSQYAIAGRAFSDQETGGRGPRRRARDRELALSCAAVKKGLT